MSLMKRRNRVGESCFLVSDRLGVCCHCEGDRLGVPHFLGCDRSGVYRHLAVDRLGVNLALLDVLLQLDVWLCSHGALLIASPHLQVHLRIVEILGQSCHRQLDDHGPLCHG